MRCSLRTSSLDPARGVEATRLSSSSAASRTLLVTLLLAMMTTQPTSAATSFNSQSIPLVVVALVNAALATVATPPPSAESQPCILYNQDQEACNAAPGCVFFSVPRTKGSSLFIGCQDYDACIPFPQSACQSLRADLCFWDASKSACINRVIKTHAPTPSAPPTTRPPTVATCASRKAAEACAELGMCRWVVSKKRRTGKVKRKCKPLPTDAPTKSPIMCSNALPREACEARAPSCEWVSLSDCAEFPAPSSCTRNVTYGCMESDAPNCHRIKKGKYPRTQCLALEPWCAWRGVKPKACVFPYELTARPTPFPTPYPTSQPPTLHPTRSPTFAPTTASPTSVSPTRAPTSTPTKFPTHAPTYRPTASPTRSPTFTACETGSASAAACAALAGADQRCEWFGNFKACRGNNNCVTTNYGCRSRGFCALTQGRLLVYQCAARGLYCVWDGSHCAERCPNFTRFSATRACSAQSTLPDGQPSRSLRFTGAVNEDQAGMTVAGGGRDFNGDGKPDILVASPNAGPKETSDRPGTGSVSILLNAPAGSGITRGVSPWIASLDNTALAPVTLHGTSLEGLFGYAVTMMDLDADGLADAVIGAPFEQSKDASAVPLTGSVYVVWGRRNVSEVNYTSLADLLAAQRWDVVVRMQIPQGGSFGFSLSTAGDFDGDGHEDLIVGAKDSALGTRGRTGEAFVVYGGRARSSYAKDFSASSPPGLYTRVAGVAAFDFFGTSLAGGGDINGDRLGDVVVGAPWVQDSSDFPGHGAAYVIYGRRERPPLIDLASGPQVAQFARIVGKKRTTDVWGNLGYAVGMSGDVNSDGFADVVVSAPRIDVGTIVDAGETYIMFGGRSLPQEISVDNATYMSGSQGGGMTLAGWGTGIGLGTAVGNTPEGFDFNGDGIPDVLVGAPFHGNLVGRAVIVYGRCEGDFPVVLNPNTMGATWGTLVNGKLANEQFGFSVAGAGDLDGDGYSDLLSGAPYSGGGSAYAVFTC